MKKFILVAALALFVSGSAFAVDVLTNTTSVTATLASTLTIKTITASTNFSLNTAGDTAGQSIGSVEIYTNRRNWKVGFTSTNLGKLMSSTYEIPYTVNFTGAGNLTSIAATDQSLATAKEYTLATRTTFGQVAGDSIGMTIEYGAENATNWFAGLSYTDTITVTLTAL